VSVALLIWMSVESDGVQRDPKVPPLRPTRPRRLHPRRPRPQHHRSSALTSRPRHPPIEGTEPTVIRPSFYMEAGDRGRDRPLGRPPAQIPACASNALGSCLGSWRRSAARARDAHASLSLRAASRTRSSALVTLTPALRPGRVAPVVFPLADPLPSTASAPARAGLFGSFAGTTGPSDFPSSCIEGLPPKRSPRGPSPPSPSSGRATTGPPGSRA